MSPKSTVATVSGVTIIPQSGRAQNVAPSYTHPVKVAISDYHCLDLDAPVFPAHEVVNARNARPVV